MARETAYIARVMCSVLDITSRIRPRAADAPPGDRLATVHPIGPTRPAEPRTVVTLSAANALGVEDGGLYVALVRGTETCRIRLDDADLERLEADISRAREVARRRRARTVRLVWASRRGEVAHSSPGVEGYIMETITGFVHVRDASTSEDVGWFSLDSGEPAERKDRRKPYLRLDAADIMHLRTTTSAVTTRTNGGSNERQ